MLEDLSTESQNPASAQIREITESAAKGLFYPGAGTSGLEARQLLSGDALAGIAVGR
jgi:hypothetical protein